MKVGPPTTKAAARHGHSCACMAGATAMEYRRATDDPSRRNTTQAPSSAWPERHTRTRAERLSSRRPQLLREILSLENAAFSRSYSADRSSGPASATPLASVDSCRFMGSPHGAAAPCDQRASMPPNPPRSEPRAPVRPAAMRSSQPWRSSSRPRPRRALRTEPASMAWHLCARQWLSGMKAPPRK